MSTNAAHPTNAALFRREADIFSHIRGMEALLQAPPEKADALQAKYPDAAFALMTAANLFTGDREQCAIHQEAYFSILKGESLKNIRFRYEKEMDAYVREHEERAALLVPVTYFCRRGKSLSFHKAPR